MGETAMRNMEEQSHLLNERAKFPIEIWLDQPMHMCSISTLWLRVRIGWTSLKNTLFKHYLA